MTCLLQYVGCCDIYAYNSTQICCADEVWDTYDYDECCGGTPIKRGATDGRYNDCCGGTAIKRNYYDGSMTACCDGQAYNEETHFCCLGDTIISHLTPDDCILQKARRRRRRGLPGK